MHRFKLDLLAGMSVVDMSGKRNTPILCYDRNVF